MMETAGVLKEIIKQTVHMMETAGVLKEIIKHTIQYNIFISQ